jgi:hypothetical protein
MRAALVLLLTSTLWPRVWAVDDAAVLRCRTHTESAARLACYDALSVAGPAAIAAPLAAAPAAATAQRDFGLPPAATPAGDVTAIESSIDGRFEGWGPDQSITLANGQVWRVADGTRAALNLSNPKVRIERGSFSAFYMVIDGTNHSPRVRRVR